MSGYPTRRRRLAARRRLGQVTDPCADPINADTDYCRDRLPGESVAEFNKRRLAELEAEDSLTIRITEGVRRVAGGMPLWVWATLGVLAAFTVVELVGRSRARR